MPPANLSATNPLADRRSDRIEVGVADCVGEPIEATAASAVRTPPLSDLDAKNHRTVDAFCHGPAKFREHSATGSRIASGRERPCDDHARFADVSVHHKASFGRVHRAVHPLDRVRDSVVEQGQPVEPWFDEIEQRVARGRSIEVESGTGRDPGTPSSRRRSSFARRELARTHNQSCR